jgi:UDP-N-acetylglucosamine 2-epimerase (hydrolysing)
MKKKIVFLTGTRADFGKLKSLIEITRNCNRFEVHIFATGMHMDMRYGFTVNEIVKCGFDNIYRYINHDDESLMEITLANTIEGLARFVRLIQPDLLIVHGDRVEALAGATVGALNNILVAHIEGGELSGTVDELIRHAVSKLSHTHFVANEDAKKRLMQMGELDKSIYVIGSPDMDVMLSDHLPAWSFVKDKYEIPFDDFAVSMFHPVTTEIANMDEYAEEYIKAIEQSQINYIIIYPNNDKGAEFILSKLKRLTNKNKYRLFPSVRFENFLTMMKQSKFMIGNSSAGIREAPYYGLPTVNVGTRQNGRTNNPDIIHTAYHHTDILNGIKKALQIRLQPRKLYGDGCSNNKFFNILQSDPFWATAKQKQFNDK